MKNNRRINDEKKKEKLFPAILCSGVKQKTLLSSGVQVLYTHYLNLCNKHEPINSQSPLGNPNENTCLRQKINGCSAVCSDPKQKPITDS